MMPLIDFGGGEDPGQVNSIVDLYFVLPYVRTRDKVRPPVP